MATTLAADIGLGEAIWPVDAGTPDRPVPFFAQVDGEVVLVTGASASIWYVERHQGGSAADVHSSGATISPLSLVLQTGAPVAPPVASEDSISGANMGTASPSTSLPGDAAAAGSGPDYAAIDHAHGREAQGAVVAAVAGTAPAGGTGAAAGAWDTSGHRDTAITTINEIKTQLNALIAELKSSGYIASS